MIPSGGACLVPRSEPWFPGGSTITENHCPVPKFQPRSEVVQRSNSLVGQFHLLSDDNQCQLEQDALQEATDQLLAKAGPEFFVLVDRSSGTSLGIEVEHYTDRVLIVMRINEGLVQDWNVSNHADRMEEQDLIVGANGITGDVDLILDECRKTIPLKLIVRRPEHPIRNPFPSDIEFQITLDRRDGTKLGIDVNHEDGKELFIESIDEGLVQTWNEQNPDNVVMPEDRIIEVNSVRGDVQKLLDECMEHAVLEITLARSQIDDES